MYSIGEISKIVNISVDALRYYDEIGLLKPHYIDRESRYRYYTDAQVNEILSIMEMKQYGFSLDEIKELLKADGSRQMKAYSQRLAKLISEREKLSVTIGLLQTRITELQKEEAWMDEKTVLIVDDSEFMRKVLTDILAKYSYKVIATAYNCEDAVNKYEEFRPDLVIMDIHMNYAKEGIEALKKIRTEHKEAIIVMLSAISILPNVLESIENGAIDFVIKPFCAEVLIDKLNKSSEKQYHANPDAILAFRNNVDLIKMYNTPMSQDTVDRLLELCSADNKEKITDEQINDFIGGFKTVSDVIAYTSGQSTTI